MEPVNTTYANSPGTIWPSSPWPARAQKFGGGGAIITTFIVLCLFYLGLQILGPGWCGAQSTW